LKEEAVGFFRKGTSQALISEDQVAAVPVREVNLVKNNFRAETYKL